ncbi:MAG: hypothetical protein HKN42_15720 [Granulosicoccus sp.]|nr:hypothetical protein [Granulosicoccus sp.]
MVRRPDIMQPIRSGEQWQAARQQGGFALVLVLMMILVSSMLIHGQSSTVRTDLKIARNYQDNSNALAVAEAGIHHTLALLQASDVRFDNLLADNGTGGKLTNLGIEVDPDSLGVVYRFVQFGGLSATDGYYIRVLDNHDETPDDPVDDRDNRIRLRSLGRSGNAERVVEVHLITDGGFGLFAKTKLTLSGGSQVDSFDSESGDYATTVGTSARVGSNVNVHTTDSTVTIGGDVSSGGTITGPGVITGTSETGLPPVSFASIAACGPPYSDTTGISGTYTYNGTTDGDLTATGSGSIVLAPGTYCFDEIKLSGSSTLEVTSGPVEIYLTGTSDLTGGGIVNSTNKPTDLIIYSTGSSLKVAGGSSMHAAIYAPDADLTITGGSHFYGAAIADTITLSGGTNFHVDKNAGSGADLEMESWREIRTP